MVLISPELDAVQGGHTLYCSVNNFHFHYLLPTHAQLIKTLHI